MNVKNSLIRKGSLHNVCNVKLLFIHLCEVYFCRFAKTLVVIIGPIGAVLNDYRQKQIFIFNNVLYLGQPKSNGVGALFSYRKLEENFFFYLVIEQTILYFSVVFDCSSINTIIIKPQERAVCYEMCW